MKDASFGVNELREPAGRAIQFVVLQTPNWVISSYVVGSCVIYIIIMLHLPMQLKPFAVHDDGLFMNLGQSLAEGNWLGDFSQFTLMKGPGFPGFLAINSWLGIPISLGLALFHCFTVISFVNICSRFIRNCSISLILFTLLLWHPISFRIRSVSREEIYGGQTLLVLGLVVWPLFCPVGTRYRRLYAALAGAGLGWFWLTREEGVWIVPGLGLMVFFAIFRLIDQQWDMLRHPNALFKDRALRGLAGILTITVGVFISMQIGFYSANGLAYGKFVGVDVKEKNFQRALRAIDSVRSGGTKPFVSITHAAMQRVESVSPAFASLAPFFDGPRKPWVNMGCRYRPGSCGEIGAGWFLWALRDAAASTGQYSSPSAASAFFGRLADEISAACNDGKLECKPQLVAEMPPVKWPDVIRQMLPRYADAFRLLLSLHNRPMYHHYWIPSSEFALARALRFLNYPLYSPSIKPYRPNDTISGWYYRSKADWITVEVRSPSDHAVSFNLERRSSPDIAQYFQDKEASNQRFSLTTLCNDNCEVVFRNSEGAMVSKTIKELRASPFGFDLEKGQVYIDQAGSATDPTSKVSPLDRFFKRILAAAPIYYKWIYLPILAVGFIAFLVSALVYWKRAVRNVCFVIALVSWVLVLERVALIVLIDTTSFPALFVRYLAPAYLLMVSGAVLSIAALRQVSGQMSIPNSLPGRR